MDAGIPAQANPAQDPWACRMQDDGRLDAINQIYESPPISGEEALLDIGKVLLPSTMMVQS